MIVRFQWVALASLALGCLAAESEEEQTVSAGTTLPVDDGYRGIWYFNQPSNDEYKYKYSGGMATYPQQHIPIAIYAKEVHKTFFVYGGTTARDPSEKQELLHMVSYYDHATGTVPRPRTLLNKKTSDAHDNPTLSIDENGYLWVFSSSHGTARPSYIHRSREPFSIEAFDLVLTTNFSYTQPWQVPGKGFLFLHTRYNGGREFGIDAARCLFWMTSKDGAEWEEPRMLAGIEAGDYQISWRRGARVATAFDFHPKPGGLNARANIYYLESADLGETWRTADGRAIEPPLTNRFNPALAFDSIARDRLVYLKDLNFDREGRPIILFQTSRGYQAGPENGPCEWKTIHWNGKKWDESTITSSGNNYDHGSLYIERDGTWRVIAPTTTGPQPYNPGGEMAMWVSASQGKRWEKVKDLTKESPWNHTYARRPVNAHPDFYAIWADGHGREPSGSNLYFTDREGAQVWRLPTSMEGDFAPPEIAW